MNIYKQTIRISKIRISHKLKGAITRNQRYSIFLCEDNILQNFISASV